MSTHTAFIKLWRLFAEDIDADSLVPGTSLFQRGAMELMPDRPVLVDHDKERPIGFVRELTELPDTDGSWLAALTTITAPPDWLRRGTAASISYATVQRCALPPASERVLRGLVTEVSVLSPGVPPAEPRAKVMLYRESARDEPVLQPGDRVFYGNGQVLRRPGGQVLGIR